MPKKSQKEMVGKKGIEKVSGTVIVWIILIMLLFFTFSGPLPAMNKLFGFSKGPLEDVEKDDFKFDWDKLTLEEQNNLKNQDYNRAQQLRVDQSDKYLAQAKTHLAQKKFDQAREFLERSRKLLDEVLQDEVNKPDPTVKFLVEQKILALNDFAKELEGVQKRDQLFDKLEELSPAEQQEQFNTLTIEARGTLQSSYLRKDWFFALHKGTTQTPELVETFEREQISGIKESRSDEKKKIESEIVFASALIYEEMGDKSKTTEKYKKILDARIRSDPFAPAAAYNLIFLENTAKKAQFAALKSWWEEHGKTGKYAVSLQADSSGKTPKEDLAQIEKKLLDDFVKKGYSTYTLAMELHGIVEDSDTGTEECAEFCTSTETRVTNLPATCRNTIADIDVSCKDKILQNGYRYIKSFPISTGSYRTASPPAYAVGRCSGDAIDGDNVDSVYMEGPVWMEYKLIDKLTSETLCETKRTSDPTVYATFDSIKSSYAEFPNSKGCEEFLFAHYSTSENLGEGDNNDVETVTAKMWIRPMCEKGYDRNI